MAHSNVAIVVLLCLVLAESIIIVHAQLNRFPGVVRPAVINNNFQPTQPIGEYFRPGDASGAPGSSAANLRSPCPALNTLANHGVLPRNGRNLTPQMLRNAIMTVFNVDAAFANLLTGNLPRSLTLADLSRHNFIEHDASLTRADAFYRQDPAAIHPQLASDFVSRANNGRIGIQEIGQTLRLRVQFCRQKPVGCDFGSSQRDITFREAATVLQVFGAEKRQSIRQDWAQSFLVNEQFPSDWRRSPSVVTLNELGQISRRIQLAAGV